MSEKFTKGWMTAKMAELGLLALAYEEADEDDDITPILDEYADALREIQRLQDINTEHTRFVNAAKSLQDRISQLEQQLAAKEAELQKARRVIASVYAVASGVGACPAIPCFDAEDYEAEHGRKGWVVIDQTHYDALKRLLEGNAARKEDSCQ